MSASVIVCRLLSLLLCMALAGVLVTSASNFSMRTLTEQVGKCWKMELMVVKSLVMVMKCLVMDITRGCWWKSQAIWPWLFQSPYSLEDQ